MNYILEAHQIVKQYGTRLILDNIDMVVPRGCIYGLLGPNGAGKTTFIRIANQITAPDSGSLRFDGRPIRRSDIGNIGYLPEERGLYRKMKVGEQVLYLAQLKGLSRKEAYNEANRWFARMEIGSWWEKRIDELSKGMQQKVQFITTVLHKPSLLILDEPFSGFDPINADLIKRELLQLKEQGTTIILSTHNMASVEEICTHISLINKSRCILQGEVQQIRREYKTGEWALGYEGDGEGLQAALSKLSCTVGQIGEGRISIHAEGAEGNQILRTALEHVRVCDFRELLPGMNDIFIRKVNQE